MMTDSPTLPSLPPEANASLSAPSASAAQPLSRLKRVFLYGGLGCLLALTAVAIWFNWQVPVSDMDIQHDSWLGDSHPDTFMTGLVGTGIALMCLFGGGAVGILKNSPVPPLVAMMLSFFLSNVTGYHAQLRWGEMTGDARIGCFEWSSKECRQMLGVPTVSALSMYTPDVRDDLPAHRADWYIQRIREFEAQKKSHVLEYLEHPERLKARMDAERAEVARFRATKGVTH
jgi:hypothetical protein